MDFDQRVHYQKQPFANQALEVAQRYVNTLYLQTTAISQVVYNVLSEVESTIDKTLDSFRSRLHAGCEEIIKAKIPYFILTSLQFSKTDILKWQVDADCFINAMTKESNSRTTKKCRLVTDDGAELDGISIISTQKTPRKAFVFFLANNELWQNHIKQLYALCVMSGFDLYCYNYRGTGFSSGIATTEQLLVNDALQQVQSLIDKRIAPKNIYLFGSHCIGAGVAIKAAASLANDGTVVNVSADRGPRSIQEWVKASGIYYKEPIASLFAQYNWQLNIENDLPSLSGQLTLIHNANDPLIPYHASIKQALDSASKPVKAMVTVIEMDDAEFNKEVEGVALAPPINSHVRPLSTEESQKFLTALSTRVL